MDWVKFAKFGKLRPSFAGKEMLMRIAPLSRSSLLPKALLVAAALFACTAAAVPVASTNGIQGTGAISGGIEGTG